MRGLIFMISLLLAGLGIVLLVTTDMLDWGTNILIIGAVGAGLCIYLPRGNDGYDERSY